MSTNTEALRGIRAFGPEHFEHLEGLIAERDQLLDAARAAKLALDDLHHAKDGRDWWTQRDTATKLIDAAIAKTTGQ